MKYKKVIFVVLVYGNYKDLLNFNKSISLNNEDYHLVVVDSYKDDKTRNEGRNVCRILGASFLPIENRGYSYGNNQGVKYAQNNFDFDYLIISNPDIIIKRLEFEQIPLNSIMGPRILNKRGSDKNPHYYKKSSVDFYFLKKYAFSEKKTFWFFSYLLGHKIKKICYDFFYNNLDKDRNICVYALHGSFLAMRKRTVDYLAPLFNEKMFLYSEENHLAELADKKNIAMIYNKDWIVSHSEDGSGNFGNKFTQKHTIESLRVFFRTWK
jgi:GT2 family glycosyltransferase